MKRLKLSEISRLIGSKSKAGKDPLISGLAGLESATKGDITFLADSKYLAAAKKTKASAIIVSDKIKFDSSIPKLFVTDANSAFATLARSFTSIEAKPRIDASAQVSKKAKIGKNVTIMENAIIEEAIVGGDCVIYPFSFIGKGVKLGKNCAIFHGVTILDGTQVGDNVVIHPGTVIGSDGFGYIKENTKYKKIPQIGNVVIEADVEIGANCTIDRARLDSTIIGRGVKIDNLVHIAHNVQVGEDTVILCQVAVAGSTKIGRGCLILGQAAISDHIVIHDNAIIGGQAGVAKDVPKGAFVTGTPARDKSKLYRDLAYIEKLPELYELVKKKLKNKAFS